jgi:hypothetical protein
MRGPRDEVPGVDPRIQGSTRRLRQFADDRDGSPAMTATAE